MKTILRSSFVLLALAAAVACSESLETPTSPSTGNGSLALTAEQLAGTWNLVSIQPAGQAEQPKPSGATYTLAFADGRISTRADCNMCNAPYTLSGTTLNTGNTMACTLAACPTMAFENTYTRILAGESTVTLSSSVLVLSSARGVLRFSR